MLLASDIETIGKYRSVNSKDDIHCFCSIDIETNKVYLFHNRPEFDNATVVDSFDNKEYIIPARTGTLDDGLAFWEQVSANNGKLIIHNCHTYDRPIIDKIWPNNKITFSTYHDTFIQSKVQWFERPTPKGAKSPHGLKAYGIKFGINKPEITDWTTIDAFKLHRCIEDCKIQAMTYKHLQKEFNTFKKEFNADFSQALAIEALYADACFKQEEHGLKIDVEHARKCIEWLDNKIEELELKITPHLPPTLKCPSAKLSRKELAVVLGFNPDKVKDTFVQKKKNGVVDTVVEKPYYKPITKIYAITKTKKYFGFHISYGVSEYFDKKNELLSWIKGTHPDTKTKDWQIDKLELEEKLLNPAVASWFGLEATNLDVVVGWYSKVEIEPSTMKQTEMVKEFLIKLGWKDAEEWNLKTDVNGNYIKVETTTEVRWPAKASPENQMVKVLEKGELMVSSPKLSEEDYKQLPEGVGTDIAEYNTYQHRRRFLENKDDPENKGVLSYLDKNNRIPAGVNNFATRSGRGSQRIWVNSPSESALFGKEIRQCVIAEEGKVLVGIDMKSAQLSIAAYYANNGGYYQSVATGAEDNKETKEYIGLSAHCVNARMFGLVSEADWVKAVETQDKDLIKKISLQRKLSKGASFGVLFGCSGKKLAKMVDITPKEGEASKKRFLEQMGLSTTINKLKEFEDKNKYGGGFLLPLAFGYWLWNNSTHKSVNTIVQGFEALAQKLMTIRLHRELKRNGLSDKANMVLDVHDEKLLEVDIGYEKEVARLAGEAYTWAAEQIYQYHLRKPEEFPNTTPPKFCIDLNGGAKIGNNYYDVH